MFSAQLSNELASSKLTSSEQIALWNFLEKNYAKEAFNIILEGEETSTLFLLEKLFPSIELNLDEKTVGQNALKKSSIYKFTGDFFACFLQFFNSNLKCEEIIQLEKKRQRLLGINFKNLYL